MTPRLASLVVRRRRLVLLAWAVAAALLAPLARTLPARLDVSSRAAGSESAEVERVVAERFRTPFARHAVLVATGVPSPDTDAGRLALRRIVAALDSAPEVSRVLSHLTAADEAFAPATGGTFVVAGLRADSSSPDHVVPALRRATERLAAELRVEHPRIALRWTGELPLNHDLRRASAADAAGAERRALPLTVALLLAAFGTVVAALLPAASAILSIVAALGLAAIAAAHWPLSILLQNVVSMLGLGLGVDYALLVVSRFRERVADGASHERAAEDAALHAGRTVAVSGAAVAIGLAALLLVPVAELRAVAVGALLVVAMCVLSATTLLPAVLAALGPRVERGRVPVRLALGEARWEAIARGVVRRPATTIALLGTPLVALALAGRPGTVCRALNAVGRVPSAECRVPSDDLPRGDWLPARMESALALADLRAMGRAGVAQSLRIVVEMPEGVRALDARGWGATARLGAALAREPRVARVRSLPAVVGADRPGDHLIALLPADLLRSFASTDGRLAMLEVVPAEREGPTGAMHLARGLRHEAAAHLALPGARVLVGGLPAINADFRDAIAGAFPQVVALVLLGTFVALAAAFRSVLVPAKALLLNLLSVGAAFGATALVFQGPYGLHRIVGLDAPLDGTFPAVPLLVFCTVFGLSMDYEVFLVSRVAEARRAGLGHDEAIVDGVARTGGVITSAALVMIAVFAAFALGDFVLMKMLGFALAVAVLLDATVVRVALGPALLRLAGRWNWWPGERRGMFPAALERHTAAPESPPTCPTPRPSPTRV